MANDSAIWQQAARTTYLQCIISYPAHKSLSLNEKLSSATTPRQNGCITQLHKFAWLASFTSVKRTTE